MREFFKTWRTKGGVVTLAMACVLMVGWVYPWPKDYGYRLMLDVSADRIGIECDRITPSAIKSMSMANTVFRWSARYWSFVILLAMLAAWLLLSKPERLPGKR